MSYQGKLYGIVETLPQIIDDFKTVKSIREWKDLSRQLSEIYGDIKEAGRPCEPCGWPNNSWTKEHEEYGRLQKEAEDLYETAAREKTIAVNRIRKTADNKPKGKSNDQCSTPS